MRKVSLDASTAMIERREFSRSNTVVKILSNNSVDMFLHGNRIARLCDGFLLFSLCGYNTKTTKERLNTLFYMTGKPYRIRNIKKVPHICYEKSGINIPITESGIYCPDVTIDI